MNSHRFAAQLRQPAVARQKNFIHRGDFPLKSSHKDACGIKKNVMFEKFTEKAKRSIIYARKEYDKYGGNSITTSHLLLGLLHFDQEQPAMVLTKLGVSIKALIEDIREKLPKAIGNQFGDVPFTSNASSAMRFVVERCEKEKCPQTDLTDLLLGLLSIESCSAAQVLNKYSVTEDKVRRIMKGIKTYHLCRGDRS